MNAQATEIAVGDRFKVVGYTKGDRQTRARLLEMGLTPATEFSVARIAPLGDPIEIRLRGFSLSLRKAEAAALKTERL